MSAQVRPEARFCCYLQYFRRVGPSKGTIAPEGLPEASREPFGRLLGGSWGPLGSLMAAFSGLLAVTWGVLEALGGLRGRLEGLLALL